jgi:hypothetical protein
MPDFTGWLARDGVQSSLLVRHCPEARARVAGSQHLALFGEHKRGRLSRMSGVPRYPARVTNAEALLNDDGEKARNEPEIPEERVAEQPGALTNRPNRRRTDNELVTEGKCSRRMVVVVSWEVSLLWGQPACASAAVCFVHANKRTPPPASSSSPTPLQNPQSAAATSHPSLSSLIPSLKLCNTRYTLTTS